MFRKFFFLALLWFAALAPCHGTTVLPLQLDQIIAGAELVFQGTCTANRSDRDAQTGLIVTYTTFDVQEVLKGNLGRVHTIKQIGGQIDAAEYHVEGVPSFVIGQEYVVFLYGRSSAGFSSPVGLGQGQFVVTIGAGGKQLSNGRDFNELIPETPAWAADKPSHAGAQGDVGEMHHLGLDDFKRMVRRHAGDAK